jgi:RNA polymerase sigma-70 factor (ECF subfamily)
MAEPKPARIYLVATSTHPDDKALANALLAGQPGAANKVWHKYEPMVRRMLARAMGPDRDVDDLTQDVFLTFFDKLPGLRKPESLRSFLISVTTFTMRAELRRRWVRRIMRLSSDGQLPEVAAEGPDRDEREALSRFYRVLDGLSADDRTAFTLRFVEGLELLEVAEAMNISLATLKRRLGPIYERVLAQVKLDPLLAAYVPSLATVDNAGGAS